MQCMLASATTCCLVSRLLTLFLSALATPPPLPQIRVFCRIRPNPRTAVQCLPDNISVRLPGPDGKEHTFAYDRVFKPETSQVWAGLGWRQPC